jgi:hypothetical protein
MPRGTAAAAGVVDGVAHFLYCPGMLGRRHGRARWWHRVHLIPGRWLAVVCNRYDGALGVTETEMRRTAAR